MNRSSFVVIVGIALMAGIAIGMWYSGDTKFDRQVACAEFKDSAERRIRDYYAPEEVNNHTPNEIFYSAKRDSCVALWEGSFTNENGIFTQKAIFDAITNEDLFSNLFWYEGRASDENKQVQAAMNTRYFEVLREVRGE